MTIQKDVEAYAPQFQPEIWTEEERHFLEPFSSNIDGLVSVLHNLPPELAGALCSRASRAEEYLLRVLFKEYIYPILCGEDKNLADELRFVVDFLRTHGFKNILNNQRAQGFYIKWLSQYGDDSIAQMTGTHIVFWGISQVAMKFLEDQRIGLEPIEKSTRYVNFGKKVSGKYLYYEPTPDLEKVGKRYAGKYRMVLDGLFETYNSLFPRVHEWLKKNFDADDRALRAKTFDVLRGLLPMATLGQVAFRGNAQAFEYMINRTIRHTLGELRWIARAAKRELDTEIPSLLLRVEKEESKEYQYYLRERKKQTARKAYDHILPGLIEDRDYIAFVPRPQVTLVEYDTLLETKILTAILFSLPEMHLGWEELFVHASRMREWEKKALFEKYLSGRKARWFKVGRALENSYLRFEIVMNIGAYRDLHRHRMLTQDRQMFTVYHGYDVPQELVEGGFADEFSEAIENVSDLYEDLLAHINPDTAQYAVTLAHRIRFYQYENIREFFHENELRTGSQGHVDYRHIEQEKFKEFQKAAPLIAPYVKVDMKDYPIARRGDTERIEKKEERMKKELSKR